MPRSEVERALREWREAERRLEELGKPGSPEVELERARERVRKAQEAYRRAMEDVERDYNAATGLA
jgi:hypothetical protein